jgi:hypothetical protein
VSLQYNVIRGQDSSIWMTSQTSSKSQSIIWEAKKMEQNLSALPEMAAHLSHNFKPRRLQMPSTMINYKKIIDRKKRPALSNAKILTIFGKIGGTR